MAAVINTYGGLQDAIAAWMARDGDTDITDRFDDLIALHENRMYYGAAEVPGMLPACEPLRIREMETVNASFTLAATVAQPTGFLELIECRLNNEDYRLDVVAEGTLDGYRAGALGGPAVLAISGTNFRVMDDPGASYTATLRYFAKLATPSASADNWILTYAPNVYLDGCLFEASKMTGDAQAAALYLSSYASNVRALNQRRNSELRNATNVRMRLRGRTP
jgi:hypothetical protein